MGKITSILTSRPLMIVAGIMALLFVVGFVRRAL